MNTNLIVQKTDNNVNVQEKNSTLFVQKTENVTVASKVENTVLVQKTDNNIQLHGPLRGLPGPAGQDGLPGVQATVIVDHYTDLENLEEDQTDAIVRYVSVQPKELEVFDYSGGTLYEEIYVNPVPPRYAPDIEFEYSCDVIGDSMQAVAYSCEAGFIGLTMHVGMLFLNENLADVLQQNYLDTPIILPFGNNLISASNAGWFSNNAYVDLTTDEVVTVTITPNEAGNINGFSNVRLGLSNENGPVDQDMKDRHNLLFSKTPWVIFYNGVYKKIDGVWELIVRSANYLRGDYYE